MTSQLAETSSHEFNYLEEDLKSVWTLSINTKYCYKEKTELAYAFRQMIKSNTAIVTKQYCPRLESHGK